MQIGGRCQRLRATGAGADRGAFRRLLDGLAAKCKLRAAGLPGAGQPRFWGEECTRRLVTFQGPSPF